MEVFYHALKEVGRDNEERKYKVVVRIAMALGFIEHVRFIIWGIVQRDVELEYERKDSEYAYFTGEVTLPVYAVYKYCFKYMAEYQEHTTEQYKLSVGFTTPDWAKGAVMCQIFTDRFRRGSKDELIPMGQRIIHKDWSEEPIIGPDTNGNWNFDFYGGDFKGIENSVPYLKRLGVDIIYLTPISESPSNHKYDGGDLDKPDPYFGTIEDFKSLCDTVHKHGMHIIVDVVYNHVGDDSKYFNAYGTYHYTVGAAQGEVSPYFTWFKTFRDQNGEISFDHWWDMQNLVVCDKNSKEWQEYVYGEGGNIDKLFSCGIDGLRIDVADELPDFFLEGIRRAVKRNKPDGLILGEVWKNPLETGRTYLSSGKALDTVMNYFFCSALIGYIKYGQAEQFKVATDKILGDYPEETIPVLMNFSSTHDISRLIEFFGNSQIFRRDGEWTWSLVDESYEWQRDHKLSRMEYKHSKEVAKLYLFILTFWPGILSIFYGDEVGLQGAGNLANRRPYPWGRRDKDMLKYVKFLTHIRKKNQFLRRADTKVRCITTDLLVFERTNGNDNVLVVANRSEASQDVSQYVAGRKVLAAYRYNTDLCLLQAHGAVALV